MTLGLILWPVATAPGSDKPALIENPFDCRVAVELSYHRQVIISLVAGG